MVCPLCHGNDTRFLFQQGSPYYSCRLCSFVFAKPDVNPNLANELEDFEPAYLSYLHPQKHDKKNHDAMIRRLAGLADLATARILDVGCGSGKLVRYLREKGYEAYGLEPSKALFNAFLKNEHHYYNADIGTFFKERAAEKFDVIIMADVIEHIPDPRDAMSMVANLLSPGGLLFISTPDVRSVFAKLAGRRWHYYNRYHLSLYSKANLAELAGKYGLIRVGGGYMTRHQSVYYIVQYALNFVFHTGRKAPAFLLRMNVPVNLFDMMYNIYRKHY